MIKNKKQKTSKAKRNIAKLLIAFLIATILVMGYFKFSDNDSANNSQNEQSLAEQVDVDQAKQKAEEEKSNNTDDPLKDDGSEDPEVPVSGSVVVGTPSFSQANGMINSSVAVSGASAGSCKFTFTDADGRPVIRSVKLADGSCSVSIPEAEFTLLGTWTLNVEFGGKSVSRSVEVN